MVLELKTAKSGTSKAAVRRRGCQNHLGTQKSHSAVTFNGVSHFLQNVDEEKP